MYRNTYAENAYYHKRPRGRGQGFGKGAGNGLSLRRITASRRAYSDGQNGQSARRGGGNAS